MRNCVVAVLAIALVLSIGGAAAEAAYKLRIGHHAAAFGSVDVVAAAMGYFDKTLGKGNYELKQFKQGKLMAQAILARGVDVAQAAARPYVGYLGKGTKGMVAIGIQSYWCKASVLMVKPNSPYKSIQDLKGKKLVAGKATSTYYGFTRFILPAVGLSEKDYQVVNAVTTDRIPALVNGTVDFALTTEPLPSIAEAKGLVRRIKGVDFCKYDDPPFVIVADPRKVKNHPKVIENYLRAFLKGADLFTNNFDKFASVYRNELVKKGKKVSLKTIKAGLKSISMHPQIDSRFYNYVNKMAKVLKKDKKINVIPDFKKTGVIESPMKAAMGNPLN